MRRNRPYAEWPQAMKDRHLARVRAWRAKNVAAGLCRCGRTPKLWRKSCGRCALGSERKALAHIVGSVTEQRQ